MSENTTKYLNHIIDEMIVIDSHNNPEWIYPDKVGLYCKNKKLIALVSDCSSGIIWYARQNE